MPRIRRVTGEAVPSSRFGLYVPSGRVGLGSEVFGKDVANFELYQALVRHGGFERVDVLTHAPADAAALRSGLAISDDCTTVIGNADVLDPRSGPAAGVVLRGQPRIEDLAWRRRETSGDEGYSLMGLIHTIAPPAMREEIAGAAIAPLQPWDAMICTSPSVKSAMERMFDAWEEYLRHRFGGTRRTRPMLPLVPLGVNGRAIRSRTGDPEVRAGMRRRLGVEAEDVLVIWVGRLSYFEKAFPQPMMRAVAEAGARTGKRVHLAMAGWFPSPATDERNYREAAAAYGPDMPFHLIDGNDRTAVDALWAGGDIFLSLVDNIQETFGITPLEAMAAGLPVVVSDWDGYRYTVQDGIQGFCVPTLLAPGGAFPDTFAASHAFLQQSYQQYVGILAQHTAVDVEAAAVALARLIEDPDLRRRMGEAGQERVRTTFDWSVVAPQYRALADELTAIRTIGDDRAGARGSHPARGEPLADFAHFATSILEDTVLVSLRPEGGQGDLERAGRLWLDSFARRWRATPQECAVILDRLQLGGPATVGELLRDAPEGRRGALRLGLVWMVKLGILGWR